MLQQDESLLRKIGGRWQRGQPCILSQSVEIILSFSIFNPRKQGRSIAACEEMLRQPEI